MGILWRSAAADIESNRRDTYREKRGNYFERGLIDAFSQCLS